MISLKRIFCTCCLLLSVWAVFAQGPSEWKALEKPLNFYLANDLGRNGYYDQKPIAELMGQMAEQGVFRILQVQKGIQVGAHAEQADMRGHCITHERNVFYGIRNTVPPR